MKPILYRHRRPPGGRLSNHFIISNQIFSGVFPLFVMNLDSIAREVIVKDNNTITNGGL